MVLISLDCSNMVANIIKIFETCKSFWPESEDFVNFATVFVNSATPRGRGIKAPKNLPGGQVPGRPAENKTAELITMKDELGGEYVFNDSFAEYAKVSSGLLLKRFCSVPRTRSTDRP